MRAVPTVPKPTGRRTPTDAPPIVENPVPEPRVTVTRVERVIHQLGAADHAIRVATREIEGDLRAEEERLRLVARQQPGWEAQRVVGLAEQAIEAIQTFVGLVAEARGMIDELGPALDAADEGLTRERAAASHIHLLERLDLYAADLEKARRVWDHLRRLTEKYEAWVPAARVSAGRIARAAARVAREYVVAGLAGRLQGLSRDLANLRAAPMPPDAKIRVTLARAEALVGSSLPVPAITWPASTDPFAGPELQEP